MRTLNLGILAHVDAGKTTLTERLLHHAGVIGSVGSVDAGTTHTDSLELERQRGITIKAAVASFALCGVRVNLIDTPGHPDFIAEVERSLAVLDGAVLVISAVEGVQAQTRLLMRALQRLGIPTLLFVNKIDRLGARHDGLLRDIRDKLSPSIVVLTEPRDMGTRSATVAPLAAVDIDASAAADHDDAFLQMLVDGGDAGDGTVAEDMVVEVVERLSRRGRLHPVLFGCALTGTGVDLVAQAIADLLPARVHDQSGPPGATVFKIDRGGAGDRVAFARLFRGTLRVRDRFDGQAVTKLEVFHDGATVQRPQAVAGDIVKVWGLADVRVGDTIGTVPRSLRSRTHRFAPPTLETVVVPRDADRVAAGAALAQLAEQDPLIQLRQDENTGELRLSLYGEVQKQVIEATLASEFGVVVDFCESTPLCIERVVGPGEAIERMPRGRSSSRPFLAGVGLRIEPARVGNGLTYRPESQFGALPAAFHKAIAETVAEALRQGLYGWEVADCIVTLTASQYAPRQSHAHQGFSKAMSSVGSDFRFLTPLVVMAALQRAQTIVCEPIHRYELELPVDVLPVMIPLLGRLDAPPLDQQARGAVAVLCGDVRAADIHTLQQHIPDLTRGEGVLVTEFDSHRPVRGEPPRRVRTDFNPLNRHEYLLKVSGAVVAPTA